ncbi:molybdopterin synthase catalytic subunit-like [Paramacrobiotus metropolitanus]|uniref:molybdopterin synthase catalytic subunit-like n=1 Tax=Paramacrobiotus metropolitanus TaxID=2943436 RepID=UPI002445AA8B|nr:molybdopterin synthase catalytic subunit-like [Paramacrobiotus metropolitanus]
MPITGIDVLIMSENPLCIDEYIAKLTNAPASAGCGGTAIFIGTSRSSSKISDKEVIALDYQAYVPMAEKKLKEICSQLRQQFISIGSIVLVHRIGYAPVGEAGLFVGISAPHRQAAIECMDAAITEIKAKLPVWKQEVYIDGSRSWTVNPECLWSAKGAEASKLNQTEKVLVNGST